MLVEILNVLIGEQIFLFVCILYLKGAYMCVFFTIFNWGQIFKDVLLLEYYIKFEFSS